MYGFVRKKILYNYKTHIFTQISIEGKNKSLKNICRACKTMWKEEQNIKDKKVAEWNVCYGV